jgi:hypothetical protein
VSIHPKTKSGPRPAIAKLSFEELLEMIDTEEGTLCISEEELEKLRQACAEGPPTERRLALVEAWAKRMNEYPEEK